MNTIGLFGKYPRPGRVKTRLATELGHDPAAKLYAAFMDDLTFRFRATGDRRVFGYSPGDAARYFSQYEKLGYELWPQSEGELGWKIASFFKHALSVQSAGMGRVHEAEQGGNPDDEITVELTSASDQEITVDLTPVGVPDCRAVLIGTDSPTLPVEFVQQAFEMLHEVDCVLGPATDGGYYLIGLRRPAPALFDHVAWSGPNVLRQTVQRIATAGLTLGLLAPWYDIDTLADLQMLAGHIRAMTHAGQTQPCPMTAAVLRELRLLDNPACNPMALTLEK